MAMSDSVRVEARVDRNVALLTLNDPERRNALSGAMIAELQSCLDAIAGDASVHVVILSATGPAFSAGHDLKEITAHRNDPDRGEAFFQEIMRACSTLMQSIVTLPQPVIAAVQGVATAAGCQLVASCDLALAATTARFCTPGVNIGLFCSTPMVALTRNVAPKAAMGMLMSGDMIDAQEALRIGLVNSLSAPEALMDDASRLALSIAGKSPLVVRAGKAAFHRQSQMSLEDAYAYASDVMVANLLARDSEEGIDAFLTKRPPRWEGR